MCSSPNQKITLYAASESNPKDKVILRRYTQYFDEPSPAPRRRLVIVAKDEGEREGEREPDPQDELISMERLQDEEVAGSDDQESESVSEDESSWMMEESPEIASEASNPRFGSSVQEARRALDVGVYPVATGLGTSGSYFIISKAGEHLAIFKPRDEEPFSTNNPNWMKWVQRLFCCCCFGRGMLIPGTGYLSETAASIVDERLQLNIVPTTRVQKLISPTFHYGQGCCRGKLDPKPKEGSYQIYVKGYRNARQVLDEWTKKGLNKALTPEELNIFTVEFQKMCIIDYLIRNTDRHADNWMIRHVPGKELRIAAIDNGLSFPIRHPEHESVFRRFPFDWSTLSWAYKPWDEGLRNRLLELMTPHFIHDLAKDLRKLFRSNKMKNHLLTREHIRFFTREQIRVFRGQAWNLRLSLLAGESPFQLVKRRPVLVRRRYHGVPPSNSWEECFRPMLDRSCSQAMCSIM